MYSIWGWLRGYKYMCPCNEKVCNYPVFACVKCIVCASAIRMTRMQNGSFIRTQNSVFTSLPNYHV